MEIATGTAFGENYYTQYRIGGWGTGLIGHRLYYSRAGDATTLVYNDGWRMMFEANFGSDNVNREWIWALPFDSKFRPENSLIKLFSPVGGDYLVKPSQQMFDIWDSETQLAAQGSSIPYDARKLLSTSMIGGQPVVMKFLYNYLNYSSLAPASLLTKNGKWFLYRQTHLHLRFSEAANRSGRSRLAWGLWNGGIASAYPAPGSDVTMYHNSLQDPYPFNFDARNSGNSGVPYYRADWYRNTGIRGRANLINVTNIPTTDSMIVIEDGLIKEEALENAFEGTRWAAAADRLTPQRPSLSGRSMAKFQKNGSGNAAAIRAKLMNPANWYLPFNW